jgi:hypothetical protein
MIVKRLVGVFARAADFLVEPNFEATTGIWLSAGPVQRLPRSAPPAELGAAVRVALQESRQGVPHPTDWKKFVPPVIEVAGVRSWAALQRSAAKCHIEAGTDGVKVVPLRNGGTRGDDRGYHSLGDLAVKLPATATDEELGAAVLAALAACR